MVVESWEVEKIKMENDYKAGTNNTPFTIVFSHDAFTTNDILNEKYIVTKVHDRVWWRLVLRFFGFKIAKTHKIDVKRKDNNI